MIKDSFRRQDQAEFSEAKQDKWLISPAGSLGYRRNRSIRCPLRPEFRTQDF